MGCIIAMNFAAFDLNLLRVFDALMRERSVTRAGEQVGLSQPAVSAALQRMRDILDDKLFVRQGNDMAPTPRAESLAGGVRDALHTLERLLASEREFDPAAISRTFTLMGADFFTTLFVPKLVERFATISNTLCVRFLDSARGDVERLLKEDAIDAALERPLDMPDWVSSEVLFLSPFKIIVSDTNPLIAGLADGQAMPLDVFCRLPWAMRSIDGSMSGMVDEALTKLGMARRVVLAVPHFHALIPSVSGSQMAAAVPVQFADAFAATAALRVFDLPIDVPKPEVRLYWHTRRTRDPAHAWLRQQVLDLCKGFRIPEDTSPVAAPIA